MSEAQSQETIGCNGCWPASAEAAHAASRTLAAVANLIDESHYTVRVRQCDACTQRFLCVFTESIDWSGGDDPQYWTVLPITEQEAAELIRAGDAVTEGMINALGKNRRCLRYDSPGGGSQRLSWGTSFFVGPHD